MLGIDVVDIGRLEALLERAPGVERRLFTKREREYCAARSNPGVHLAGTLAAKEAVMKALRLGPLVAWASRIEVERDGAGAPRVRLKGGLPEEHVAVSISHDGPVAVAIALRPAAQPGPPG